MRAIAFAGAGGNEVVRIAERPHPIAGPTEVLIEVTHAGVNPADVAQREGRYPAPQGAPIDVPGIEVAGVVSQCGSDASLWSVGDRVFGLVPGGGLADHVVAHERCLAALPAHMDLQLAAAVPEAFLTAHDALSTCAHIRPGDHVLVTGANGGVGAAALQLVHAFGGTAVGTSRSATGLEFIRATGATGLLHDELANDTAEGSFDVIIDLVGGATLSRLPSLMAPQGRAVAVGIAAGSDMHISIASLMRKRASIVGTNLRHRHLEEKALAVQAFAHEVVPLLATGVLTPAIDSVFPYQDAAAAFDRLKTSGKQGKVLLAF